MFGIGLPELIVIFAIALIVVGPDKLPGLARSVAKTLMDLKKTAEDFKDSLSDEVNPLLDIKPELENAAKRFKENILEHDEEGKEDEEETADTTAQEEMHTENEEPRQEQEDELGEAQELPAKECSPVNDTPAEVPAEENSADEQSAENQTPPKQQSADVPAQERGKDA